MENVNGFIPELLKSFTSANQASTAAVPVVAAKEVTYVGFQEKYMFSPT
jgi:hypothetical protein